MIPRLFWFCVAGAAYTYAGYPGLVALLARRRQPTAVFPDCEPPVTLLIAAYNEEAVIADKLENSLALDYAPDRLQILVAADGSDDGTCEIVGSYAERGVELSYSKHRLGKTAAVNRTVSRARGEIVILSDANNLYAENVVRELTAPFQDPTVGAVTGAKIVVSGDADAGDTESLYWKYESFLKEQESRLGCCLGVCGEALAIRRSLFEAPPDEIINDDTYMALRLVRRGYRVLYASRALSTEPASLSPRDEWARRTRIFAGRYQQLARIREVMPIGQPRVAWQLVSHQALRTLLGPMMLMATVANTLAVLRPARSGPGGLWRLAPPFGRRLLALQGLLYGLAVVGRGRAGGGRLGKASRMIAFLIENNVAGVVGLLRFLRGAQSAQWERVARADNPATFSGPGAGRSARSPGSNAAGRTSRG